MKGPKGYFTTEDTEKFKDKRLTTKVTKCTKIILKKDPKYTQINTNYNH